MIDEVELKKFIARWIMIPDEQGNIQMLSELNKVFPTRSEYEEKLKEKVKSMEKK